MSDRVIDIDTCPECHKPRVIVLTGDDFAPPFVEEIRCLSGCLSPLDPTGNHVA
jgi:hypothetical protein